MLPHLPHSPEHLFPLNTTFEAFGVGIYTYMKVHCIHGVGIYTRASRHDALYVCAPHLHTHMKVVRRAADFFAVLFLMSMSNMVSNFYGGALDPEAPRPYG